MNGKNVRVIQRRSSACFLLEATHTVFIFGELGRQYFERDSPTEIHILSQVNLAHSTRANLGTNLVAAQSCAGGQGHKSNCRIVRFGVRRYLGTAHSNVVKPTALE